MAYLLGTNGPDRLAGPSSETNTIFGLASNDTLIGGALADGISGGFGTDFITAGAGDDTVDAGLGSDSVLAGDGNDIIGLDDDGSRSTDTHTANGGLGDDLIYGGNGTDRIDGSSGADAVSYLVIRTTAVTVDLAAGRGFGGDAQGDAYYSIEHAAGSIGDDVLIGSRVGNFLFGSDGDDLLRGGFGGDTLQGGSGFDTVDYSDSGRVNVNLATGTGSGGLAKGDVFIEIEGVKGGSGDDSLTGDFYANTLVGERGADELAGGFGDDQLLGGAGADVLTGGLDSDTLTGGDGADRFVFETTFDSTTDVGGRDLVLDFSGRKGDRIDLEAIDADTGARRDQAFSFIGDAEFSGESGELRVGEKRGDTLVLGDVDGDGTADFAIRFDDQISLGPVSV